MDTRTLLTFVTVSETLNYQKAADQLQYAPSTIFKHIQQLEIEMGKPLLTRNGRALRLTEAGEKFLPHAQRMLSEYREALSLKEDTVCVLTIGGCEINVGNSLLPLLSRFTANYPNIRINMITAPNALIPEMVRSGQVDLGFYYSSGSSHRDLQDIRLYREPVYLAASSSNPLSRKPGLHYEDLQGMQFVYSHESCCFVSMLMHELESRNVILSRMTYVGEIQLVMERAQRDNVITLVPHCAMERFENSYGLVRLDMEEETFSFWETILLGKNANGPAVQQLVRFSQSEGERIACENALEVAPIQRWESS